MGFLWDVVRDIAKMAVNVHTLGAFDVRACDEDEPRPSSSRSTTRSATAVREEPPAPKPELMTNAWR
jgi:hypothetical protein